jgi:hypothetical protein
VTSVVFQILTYIVPAQCLFALVVGLWDNCMEIAQWSAGYVMNMLAPLVLAVLCVGIVSVEAISIVIFGIVLLALWCCATVST